MAKKRGVAATLLAEAKFFIGNMFPLRFHVYVSVPCRELAAMDLRVSKKRGFAAALLAEAKARAVEAAELRRAAERLGVLEREAATSAQHATVTNPAYYAWKRIVQTLRHAVERLGHLGARGRDLCAAHHSDIYFQRYPLETQT